jgi:hypothetical protein
VSLFFEIIPKNTDNFQASGESLKFRRCTNWAVAFADIYYEASSLLQNYRRYKLHCERRINETLIITPTNAQLVFIIYCLPTCFDLYRSSGHQGIRKVIKLYMEFYAQISFPTICVLNVLIFIMLRSALVTHCTHQSECAFELS